MYNQPQNWQPEVAAAQKKASNSLIWAIIGIFICWIIFEPLAIVQARQAKQVLRPGDPGYGNAQAAEIIGWIVLALVVVSFVVILATGVLGAALGQ